MINQDEALLIRHAETVHNVKRVFAGVTDSSLTNHGALQIGCLAEYLSSEGLRFTKVFSSDLKRASTTAQALCDISCQAQQPSRELGMAPILSQDIRERDFGSLEGQCWSMSLRPKPHQQFKAQESESSMKARAMVFLNENILPPLARVKANEETVAVVSHGIILSILYRCLSSLFSPQAIYPPSRTDKGGFSAWSNTGYLELDIKEPTTPALPVTSSAPGETPSDDMVSEPTLLRSKLETTPALAGWQMRILTINGQAHLSKLKRTRGGIGASRHDKRQKRIDTFFVKPNRAD